MSANEDKIQGVCSFAQRLCQENHYLGMIFFTQDFIQIFSSRKQCFIQCESQEGATPPEIDFVLQEFTV
jgi:hypothetical protein